TLVDNPFLVSKSAVHARSHPFTGERLEVVTITGRKLIYRLQQADRAFLEQICNAEAPVGAFPGGNHHPVEVRAGERIPCLGVAETRRLQETPELCRRRMGARPAASARSSTSRSSDPCLPASGFGRGDIARNCRRLSRKCRRISNALNPTKQAS